MDAVKQILFGFSLLAAPFMHMRNYSRTDRRGPAVDAERIASDFAAVGTDLRKAMGSSYVQSAYRNSGSDSRRRQSSGRQS
jgi:hypothetical protein